MKFKKEYLILVVVIAALGSYLAFKNSDNTHYQLPTLGKLADADITRLTVEKTGTTLELKKTGDGWVIGPEGYPADKTQVEPMLKNIASVELTALVSEGENYHPYELDPEHRLQVTAWKGADKARSIDIGKTASSYRHTFVKLPDDPRVFHAGENIRDAFAKDKDSLRDKTVLTVEKPKVAGIKIDKGEQARQLVLNQPAPAVNVADAKPEAKPGEEGTKAPEQPSWKTATGETVDQAAVDKLLGSVTDLKCESFIDGKKKADFTAPIYTLTLNGDQTHTLSIFAKPENGDSYPATSSGSEYPFNISSYKAEEIMKHLVEEPKPEPAAEEAKPAAKETGKKTGKAAKKKAGK